MKTETNQRESQDTHVRRGIDRQRQRTRCHRCQGRARPSRQQQSRNAAGRGEEQRFGERLPDDAHAPGTDGQADRGFPAPRFGARQHQVRDVRTRDDEHEPDQAHQDHERRGELAAQARGPGRRVGDDQPALEHALPELGLSVPPATSSRTRS